MTDEVDAPRPSSQGFAHLFGEGGTGGGRPSPRLVIGGFGRLGQAVAHASVEAGSASRVSVIAREHDGAEFARKRGFNVVCGYAVDSHVQRVAGVGSAAEIVVCIDPPSSETIVRIARGLAPIGRIQVGISEPGRTKEIRAAGADHVLVVSTIAGKLLADSVLPL